jgi:hypothetical protein
VLLHKKCFNTLKVSLKRGETMQSEMKIQVAFPDDSAPYIGMMRRDGKSVVVVSKRVRGTFAKNT